MNELLKKDINIKIISVFFAIFLWFFVLDNSANPFEKRSFTIPLKIENETLLQEKGIGVRNHNYTRSVTIDIRGRQDKIGNISESDFEAVLDFSKVKEPGNKDLRVEVRNYKNGISIQEIKPQIVNVEFEKIITQEFPVEIVTTGKIMENYKIVKTSVMPETITITGIESLIKSVDSVRASVDVNGLNKIPVMRKECKVYSKSGDEIAELSKNINVDISMEVAKEVPVFTVFKGKLAKDFVEKGSRVNPERVLITGLPESLDKINSVTTEIVNIENINRDTDIISFLKVPEGVRLVDSSREVTVSVLVEQLQRKDITIPREAITIVNAEPEGMMKYEVVNPSIVISVKGRQKDLEQFDTAALKPIIDVARLPEGDHKIPLKLTLPGDISQVEEFWVEVKISKNQPPAQ